MNLLNRTDSALNLLSSGDFTIGTYQATDNFINRVRAETQACVSDTKGNLIAVTGEFSNPKSRAEAYLMAHSKVMLEILAMLVDHPCDLEVHAKAREHVETILDGLDEAVSERIARAA
jgi:hypothetical protein